MKLWVGIVIVLVLILAIVIGIAIVRKKNKQKEQAATVQTTKLDDATWSQQKEQQYQALDRSNPAFVEAFWANLRKELSM